jgi:type II restriction/modification system DNA methylase subunit YeeA
MNRTKLKNYAPQARREFIQAMTDRAAYFGLTDTKSEPVVEKGDVAVIGGRSFPIAVAKKRKALEDRIKRHGPDWSKGFAQTMEAMAYTWFNRLVAIRFMELHGYLDHGYRVLSHPEGKPTPEILEHAEHVELPGLKKEAVIDLKLAGNKEGELYRLLLTAQCNALHTAMPFLFEKIEDETELLLPDNLLNSDSLMRKLVGEIEEEDWNEVEIIGWLYQFYISEKKDEVIGKVVASEDIPAATQLFTPNWIVKYLVQNTLGRQWLEHHPESPLKAKMEYYIEPAEQTSDVQAQLQQVIEARTKANRGLTADCPLPSADFSLNPEELTLLDPACGSGHILVEAYDLFKAIYQERGYRAKDIPALILQKNLFGMEIDDRAAQLAAFALMMKARADDRRIFDSEAKPNILAFEDSQGLKASDIYFALTSPLKGEREDELESSAPDGHLFETDDNLFTRAEAAKAAASRTLTTVNFSQADIASLLELFENAKTFGSLIQVPPKLAAKLPEIENRLNAVLTHGDLTHASAHVLKPLLQQARLLARQYDAIVANPPYMGSKGMNPYLKSFAKEAFPGSKSDLFAVFSERVISFVHANRFIGLMTPFTWMFIKSYETLRRRVVQENTLASLIQPEYHAFFDSAFVPICAFVVHKAQLPAYSGAFIGLSDFYGEDVQPIKALEAIRDEGCTWRFAASSRDFQQIPSSPIAYWVSKRVRNVFSTSKPLGEMASVKHGMSTGNNGKFLRRWSEVSFSTIGLNCQTQDEAAATKRQWFPYNKGGAFRKWYGNNEFVVNYRNRGEDMLSGFNDGSNTGFRHDNHQLYFKPSVTWSFISSSFFGVRLSEQGFVFDVAGSSAFPSEELMNIVGGFLCSKVAFEFMKIMNPTLNFQVGNVASLPFDPKVIAPIARTADRLVVDAVALSKRDWDSFEESWSFGTHGFLASKQTNDTIDKSFETWAERCSTAIQDLKAIEEENNGIFIKAYGLQDELSPEVPEDQVTLYRPNREEDAKRLISYAIGCIMGRYSLDKPGLIYAHAGNQDFDESQYKTFRADDDGIIPLLETDWGIRDDATNRFVEFIGVAWPKEYLEENLNFVADSLVATGNEQPRETIRRYLATGFYKHHLSMYKKRPIYWLFSSGKQRAFQCLVYLHRYHEGTLARMRTEYVIPLQGQIAARIEQLEGDKSKATSTSHRKSLQKEQDDLKKQQTELLTFEEKLKHAADQKISLDLDEGVKVNYAKFGDLLAESKAICGTKDDD